MLTIIRRLALIAAVCIIGAVPVSAQTRINNFPITGAFMPQGSDLNKMVAALNNLQGTGTPGAITGTTGVFTGAVNTAALAASGDVTSTGTGAGSGITTATYYFTGTPAATDQVFFVATRAYRVVAISQVHSVAAGGASKLQVTKDLTTAAPGAGTDLLTNNTNAGFDLAATANTVQVGTLVATAGVTSLAAGDRLAVDFADAIQSSAGVVVTVSLAPI